VFHPSGGLAFVIHQSKVSAELEVSGLMHMRQGTDPKL